MNNDGHYGFKNSLFKVSQLELTLKVPGALKIITQIITIITIIVKLLQF